MCRRRTGPAKLWHCRQCAHRTSLRGRPQVRRFVRYDLGAGLEKKSDDFAAEVAAQTEAMAAAAEKVWSQAMLSDTGFADR